MGSDRAPGPDGFSGQFYKKSWLTVRPSVIAAVSSFFTSERLLSDVNSTLINLVPKFPNPSNVAEFRPISCCNIICKCITKIHSNRLKDCLGSLVNLA